MIDFKHLQKDKYCTWLIEKHHKNSPHFSTFLWKKSIQIILMMKNTVNSTVKYVTIYLK